MSIGKIIFTIASQNKFYSNLYAQLYSELKEKIQAIQDIFLKSYEEFIKTFEIIEYVEAEEDYDKFCLVNKDNDNRKAMSLFIVYLTNYNMIENQSIVSLAKQLIDKFQENIEKENCKKLLKKFVKIYLLLLLSVKS